MKLEYVNGNYISTFRRAVKFLLQFVESYIKFT